MQRALPATDASIVFDCAIIGTVQSITASTKQTIWQAGGQTVCGHGRGRSQPQEKKFEDTKATGMRR